MADKQPLANDPLCQVMDLVESALKRIRKAQSILSLTCTKQASIGGALSVMEVGLQTVLEAAAMLEGE